MRLLRTSNFERRCLVLPEDPRIQILTSKFIGVPTVSESTVKSTPLLPLPMPKKISNKDKRPHFGFWGRRNNPLLKTGLHLNGRSCSKHETALFLFCGETKTVFLASALSL